jgi:hypothetical protein
VTAHASPSRRLAGTARRWVALGAAVAVTIGGFGLAGLTTGTTAASAVEVSDSAVEIAWNGDGNASSIQALQPARDKTWLSEKKGLEGNPHAADFEDLKVRVSKTAGLGDELVKIDVTGMPGGTVAGDSNLPGIGVNSFSAHAQNFLQVMQCWGDPLASNFRETCQWGGVFNGTSDLNRAVAGNSFTRGIDAGIPFRSVQDKEYFLSRFTAPEGSAVLSEIVTASTTNELLAIPVRPGGTASFGFDVQTAVRAPWLGCGAADADAGPDASRSCSLVIVPRGTIYGGEEEANGGFAPNANYGDFGAQVNSPLDPAADHWESRIVVPLSFEPPAAGCGEGATRLVGGTQLLIAAMSSWQRALCESADLSFSFATSADAQGRTQLAQGAAGMAYTARSVTAEELGEGGAETLAAADLIYAPIAAAGVTVSFQYNGSNGPVTDLKLTPRLLAKLVTQSYKHAVPSGSGFDSDNAPHITHNVSTMQSDPEFSALNPQIPRGSLNGGFMADIVVAGPAGSDAHRLVWEYLQADDKARAFLGGEPDNVLPGDGANSGMTINPYYLPKGHPDALVPLYEEVPYLDSTGFEQGKKLAFVRGAQGELVTRGVGTTDLNGNPLALTEASLDTFPRADESLAPGLIQTETSRYDTIAYNPFAESLEHVSQRVFRADSKRPEWDPNAFSGDTKGAWKAKGREWGPRVRMLGITDAASSEAYGLAAAQLQLPNSEEFVAPSIASFSASLAAMPETGQTLWPDVASLPDGSYPLALPTYAAVNLPATDADARADYADLIEYAVTEGQALGEGRGQLPAGYAPLSNELRAEALAAVEKIRAYVNPVTDVDELAPGESDAPPADAGGVVPGAVPQAPAGAPADPAATQTGYSGSEAAETSATPAAPGTGAIGGALLAGVAAAAAAPFLLRRRSVG